MELLKLILFGTAYSYLSSSYFIIFILINLIVKIAMNSKIEYNINKLDPIMFIINIFAIIGKLILLQLNMLILQFNKTTIGKYYNYCDTKYIELRNYIMLYPVNLLMKQEFNINKNKNMNKTNIAEFLDELDK